MSFEPPSNPSRRVKIERKPEIISYEPMSVLTDHYLGLKMLAVHMIVLLSLNECIRNIQDSIVWHSSWRLPAKVPKKCGGVQTGGLGQLQETSLNRVPLQVRCVATAASEVWEAGNLGTPKPEKQSREWKYVMSNTLTGSYLLGKTYTDPIRDIFW